MSSSLDAEFKDQANAQRRKLYAENPVIRSKKLLAASKYQKSHRKEVNERIKKWRCLHPEKKRLEGWIRIGIDMRYWSYPQYIAMPEDQNGKCLGCGKAIVAEKPLAIQGFEVAYVDHDHVTGRVRCLLCLHCNSAIGFAGDNPNVLRKLALLLESKE